jgi:hypothetical protein
MNTLEIIAKSPKKQPISKAAFPADVGDADRKVPMSFIPGQIIPPRGQECNSPIVRQKTINNDRQDALLNTLNQTDIPANVVTANKPPVPTTLVFMYML